MVEVGGSDVGMDCGMGSHVSVAWERMLRPPSFEKTGGACTNTRQGFQGYIEWRLGTQSRWIIIRRVEILLPANLSYIVQCINRHGAAKSP